MSRACDRFVAGNGELAGLLRAVPAYEPPPRLETAVFDMAQKAQSAHDGMTNPPALAFEPPPVLEADFQFLVKRMDAAQAGRREAVLTRIASGTPAGEALETDIAPATTAWVEQQAAKRSEGAPRSAVMPARRWRLWRGLLLCRPWSEALP